jgi:hypothetical protein
MLFSPLSLYRSTTYRIITDITDLCLLRAREGIHSRHNQRKDET